MAELLELRLRFPLWLDLFAGVGFLICHFKWTFRPALPACLNNQVVCTALVVSLIRIWVWLLLRERR